MIPRKRLQLLLYVLRIFYVVGESEPNDLAGTQETVDFGSTFSLDYAEYTTPTDHTDLEYSARCTTDYPEETTDLVANELLTYDYTADNDVGRSSTVQTIDDFTKDSTILWGSPTELDDDPSLNDTETDSANCDIVWQTGIEEFEEVRNLTVNSTGIAWISLSWCPPCNDPTNVSFAYTIRICSDQECIETNENRTRYNATDLKPCSQYNFTVRALNGNRTSSGVSITAATDHKIDAIGNVQNLNVLGVNTSTIHLKWAAPAINPTCVKYYIITQCFKDRCYDTVGETTEHPADNLEPCKEYFFTVVTVAKDELRSIGANISGRTSSPEISEPQFLEAQPGNFSLHVRWQPPKLGAVCIKYYHVTVGNVTVEIASETNITIDSLYACTAYTIYINAVNLDNIDSETVTIQKETLPVVPRPPELESAEPVVSMNSAWFSWHIARRNNNCPLTSIVAVCNFTATNGQGFKPVNGNAETILDPGITDDPFTINTTVENINPYTTYTCWAYTINKAGCSEYSDPINVTTLEDVPSAPLLMIANVTDSQFVFTWETPEYLAGNLEDFEIILEGEPLYLIPAWCSYETLIVNISTNGPIFAYEYDEAKPFMSYTAKIRAKTAAGWGSYGEPLIFATKPGVSGMISHFTYDIRENDNDTNALNAILTWALPCSLNGMLEYFNVSVAGIRNGHSEHVFSIERYIAGTIGRNDRFSITLDELKGEYNYTFRVSAKIATVSETGVEACHGNILFPAGIPPQPDEEYVRSITIDPYKARRTTTSAAILLPLFPNTNGDIMYYSIIISEIGSNVASHTRFDLRLKSWPNVSSWEEAMLRDFKIPYQATRPHWDPYPNYVADYGHMKAVKYTIGEDTTCKEISSNTDKPLYCNGPLKPDTWYHVRMRAFTYGGYRDSEIFVVKTNAELNVGVVIGVVFGILFLGILTTMMLLVRKCSPQA